MLSVVSHSRVLCWNSISAGGRVRMAPLTARPSWRVPAGHGCDTGSASDKMTPSRETGRLVLTWLFMQNGCGCGCVCVCVVGFDAGCGGGGRQASKRRASDGQAAVGQAHQVGFLRRQRQPLPGPGAPRAPK